MCRFSGLKLAVVFVPVLLLPQHVLAEDPARPTDTGMIERTGVSLMLLDVEVTDKEGRPIRGLSREDFTLQLNGKPWPVYSADDVCACEEASPIQEQQAESGTAVSDTQPTTAETSPTAEQLRFIIYLDYSQLQMDGRVLAVEAAKHWVRETMRPEDDVMVAAYASQAGLRLLADFTRDKERLLSVIDKSYGAVELVDPFPSGRRMRIRRCNACCTRHPPPPCDCDECLALAAREEYFHGKHGLEALQGLLERLERVPGRKALLLFHQNGTLFPARYYDADEKRVGDHNVLLDRLAADANMSRTAIYTAYSGPGPVPERLATNFGANLADYTGGGYNRAETDLARLTRGAGRGCACIYRLGLMPPDDADGTVYRVEVEVRGHSLPNRWRVQHLSASERWMRAARGVLDNPEAATELPLVAAVVPASSGKQGWSVRVQVALDADSIVLLPSGQRQKGNWEVGALLADSKGHRTWEMLGVSALERQGDRDTLTTILHERVIEGLPPGEYELRAFVRDRLTNSYGGASATIGLPPATRPGIGGPLVLRGESRLVPTSLPLWTGGRKDPEPTSGGGTKLGVLPLGNRAAHRGEPLEFHTWLCPGKRKDSPYEVRRYVALGDEPLFQLPEPTIVNAGDCVTIRDELDTSPMADGRYSYLVRWDPGPNEEPMPAEVSFTIAGDAEGKAEPSAGTDGSSSSPAAQSLPPDAQPE